MGRRRNSHRPPRNHDVRRRDRAITPADERGALQREPAPSDAGFPAPASDRPNRRQVLAVCGLLLLAVGLVFGQTGRYEFVNLDDDQYVYENPQVAHGLTAEGVVWAFTNSRGDNWVPLTWISLMLDCQLYGLKAGGYHLTNVLLHAATAVLLFFVLQRMSGRTWPSVLVAALFAVHPLHVESVAWIAERKDVLSGLCFVLTLGAYVRFVRGPFLWRHYLLLLVIFALGLMAKPMLVTLPVLLLVLDYWPLGRMSASPSPPHCNREALIGGTDFRQAEVGRFSTLRRLVLEKIPLLILVAVFCLVTVWAQGKALASRSNLALSWRIANGLVSYVAYLVEFFYPVGLAAYYPHPEHHLPMWKTFGALVVLACISSAAVKWRRRFPYLLVGWLWYLGMLVPVIGIVQVGSQAMADRYTYLPQIGLYIALAWGAADACRSWPSRRWVCGVASALMLVLFMGCAWRQTTFWRDSEVLWVRDLACSAGNWRVPGNLLACNNFGIVLANRGQFDEAIACFEKALELKPDSAEAYFNLGLVQARHGQIDKAIAHYRKALELKPDCAEAHFNLGLALAGRGEVDSAIAHYQKALEIKPAFVEAHNNLAWLRATCPAAALRNGAEAIEHAQWANQLCGGRQPELLDTLAAAQAEAGRFPEAAATAHKALELAGQQNKRALADTLRARIALYEAGKPYHAAPSASPPALSKP